MKGRVEEMASDAAVVVAFAVAGSWPCGGEDEAVGPGLGVGGDVLEEWLLQEVGDAYASLPASDFGTSRRFLPSTRLYARSTRRSGRSLPRSMSR